MKYHIGLKLAVYIVGPGCNSSTSVQNTCAVGEKACTSRHQCIPEIWWCDSNLDCEDGSDESACSNVTCEHAAYGHVKCNSVSLYDAHLNNGY